MHGNSSRDSSGKGQSEGHGETDDSIQLKTFKKKLGGIRHVLQLVVTNETLTEKALIAAYKVQGLPSKCQDEVKPYTSITL